MSTEQTSDVQKKKAPMAGPIILLATICLVSGLSLSLLSKKLEEPIRAKKMEAFNSGLAVVLGDAESYPVLNPDATDAEKVYVSETADGLLYAAEGSAKGYQSTIRVLVSVQVPRPAGFKLDDPATFPSAPEKLTLHRITVVESGETPGLGENIKLIEKDVSLWGKLGGAKETEGVRPAFQVDFDGQDVAELDGVDVISGATITSNAVKAAVRDAVERIIKNTQQRPVE